MTTRQVRGPEVIYFSIDGVEGSLTAEDIARALLIPYEPLGDSPNAPRDEPSPTEMTRLLSGGVSTYPSCILRRELPPHLLLLDHVIRTNIFPCQHRAQRRGLVLDALYRVHQRQWFSPADLIFAALLCFEDRVHVKKLQRASTYGLFFPRLLCLILERLGFPSQPELERKHHCRDTLTADQYISRFHLGTASGSTDHQYTPPVVVQRIYELHPDAPYRPPPPVPQDPTEEQTPPQPPPTDIFRSPPPTAASSIPPAPAPVPAASVASASQAPPPPSDIQILASRMDAMQATQTQMLQLMFAMLAQQQPGQAAAFLPPQFLPPQFFPPQFFPPPPPPPADAPPEDPAPPEDAPPAP